MFNIFFVNSNVDDRFIVFIREGMVFVEIFGVLYVECSFLINIGVQEVLNKVVEMVVSFYIQSKRLIVRVLGFFKRKNKNFMLVQDQEIFFF